MNTMNINKEGLEQILSINKTDNSDSVYPLELLIYIPKNIEIIESTANITYDHFKTFGEKIESCYDALNNLSRVSIAMEDNITDILPNKVDGNTLYIDKLLKQGWNKLIITPNKLCRINLTVLTKIKYNEAETIQATDKKNGVPILSWEKPVEQCSKLYFEIKNVKRLIKGLESVCDIDSLTNGMLILFGLAKEYPRLLCVMNDREKLLNLFYEIEEELSTRYENLMDYFKTIM